MKLLLDENISPALSAVLCERGVDATSIRDRGMLGMPDQDVVKQALEEDRVIVTANADDFTGICSRADLHPGLITIASGTRAQQLEMISTALGHISGAADEAARDFMVNRVVVVTLDFDCASYPLPR